MKRLLKYCISIFLAFIFLTSISYLYLNRPLSYEADDHVTDWKYAGNCYWTHGNEGYGFGKTNNEGYMNSYDWNNSVKIDVLIMGSSQMEAMQVPMQWSTAALLNDKLPSDTVYNIGVGGHTFEINATNLNAALKKYDPQKYVIIETSDVSFSDEVLQSIINDDRERPPIISGSIYDLLRKNPFLRMIVESIRLEKAQLTTDSYIGEIQESSSAELLKKMIGKLSLEVQNQSSAELIICFHPSLTVKNDGIYPEVKKENVDLFHKACDENNILFIDMTDRFINEYEKRKVLPYGFANSPVGTGHLNKKGHEMIADEIYKLIRERN